MKKFKSLFFIFCLIIINYILCDVYMHNPRGCNNRLNESGQNRDNNNRLYDTQNNAKGGYCWGPEMHFYVGSILPIEWTAQHGCNNPNTHCEIVLQYMCGNEVRDGRTTQTPPDNAGEQSGADTYNKTVRPDPLTGEDKTVFFYGMHESYSYFQECKRRERNKGIFVADQKPKGETARYTRQNPNGNRNGFECPEERDYYPYWHPTPWKDIAILTDSIERCQYYTKESQNVKDRNYCNLTVFNNENNCRANGGSWLTSPSFDIAPPTCQIIESSRDNHLGNSPGGQPHLFNWTIPNDLHEQCVLRLRYNISTADYDPWNSNVNSSLNGIASPVSEDSSEPFMGRNYTLAFDTAQTGRTFQDRSYVFAIRPRPNGISSSATIHNLNVRGKRGNIVQVYPAVEYDFAPTHLHAKQNEYIHIQWTGCDTNPQNNDGEGTRGTDRSNIVQMKAPGDNHPASDSDISKNPLFEDSSLRFKLAYLDQNNTYCLSFDQLNEKHSGNIAEVEQDRQNCAKLNAASKYYNAGLIKLNKTGTFHYMSTRNNNFSNRSQKGVIIVEESIPTWAIALIVIGSILFAIILIGAIAILYARSHPESTINKKLSSTPLSPVLH
eukprot:TRINITY_DN1420_c0_g1_i1.p1 TRINITY_DN1420_c0_g1~~TRINITY_DN1420_c0_g1_i1.p1  ORF type:complete len:608 (+),score=310.00 TRINITY_DN1420_c0_g1_i1:76-1899(+)